MANYGINNKETYAFGANVLKIFSGKIIGQAITILVIPIITRLYDPADFGVLQVFTSITAVVIVISALRYNLSIMLPKKNEEAVNILVLSITLTCFVSLISLFLVILFKDNISLMLNIPELSYYLWFAPIVIFAGGLLNLFTYWNSRQKKFGNVAMAGVSSNLFSNAVKLILGFTGHVGPGGLIAGNISGAIIGTLYMLGRNFKNNYKLIQENVTYEKIKYWAIRYKEFPIYSSWSGLLTDATLHLPAVMLAYFFSPAIAGFYALGNRAIKVPMSLVSDAVGRVFFQKASEDVSKNIAASYVVEAVYKRLVAVSLFPFLVLVFLGRDIFVFVFGAEWAEAGYYMQFFAPWLFFVFISSPLGTIYSVLEKQRLALYINLTKFLITFVALAVGGLLNQPRSAIVVFSLSSMVLRAVICFITLRLADVSILNGIIHILKPLFYSLPFLIFIIISKIFGLGIAIDVVVVTTGGLFYAYLVINNDTLLKNILLNIKMGSKKIKGY